MRAAPTADAARSGVTRASHEEGIAGPETESTTPMWESLEGLVREKGQEMIQQILEEEVTELLGRQKSGS